MGSIGMPELMVILVIALVVFGAGKLPQIGENLGKATQNFKSATEKERIVPELAKTINKAVGEFKKTTEEVKKSIGIKDLEEMRSNLTGMIEPLIPVDMPTDGNAPSQAQGEKARQ
jgi:sec-independent protein translocase protein TatA